MATTVGERLLKVRETLGYKGRKRAAFARELGISAPSLHDLERGESKNPGVETLYKLKAKGVNPDYIVKGESHPMMLKPDPEKEMQEQALLAMFRELLAENQKNVFEIVKTIRRSQPGSSPTDPFKFDPPKDEK